MVNNILLFLIIFQNPLDRPVTVRFIINCVKDNRKKIGGDFLQNATAYSKPVTLKNILKFAVPTIAMSVFMSFYTMVDGLFVSNLIGTNALSAINLVYQIGRAHV